MGRAKDIKERIVGKAKQTLGEVIGDQSLHEDGKAQAARGRDEQDKPKEINPLKKLNQLTLLLATGLGPMGGTLKTDRRRPTSNDPFSQSARMYQILMPPFCDLTQSARGATCDRMTNADWIYLLQARRSSGESW
jgi:uncharacterized protein YjbJ (UPF0337 family)